MPEVSWDFGGRLPRAHLREGYEGMQGCKFLHFESPLGEHEVIWVTEGPSTQMRGQNVWHYEVSDDLITVSPSIHFIDHFHSPNPVRFKVDETKFWENPA